MRTLLLVVFTLICIACRTSSNIEHFSAESEFHAAVLEEMNKKPIAKKLDSLIQKIDSAPTVLPSDMQDKTLIIETYKYTDFLKVHQNKFHTPIDNKQQQKYYQRYLKHKNSFIKDPNYKVAYIDKGDYELFDTTVYKYVLKETNRLKYDPVKVIVTSDKEVYPWVALNCYYIQDRTTGKVYREITDLSILSRKK